MFAYVKQHPMAPPWSSSEWSARRVRVVSDADLQARGSSLYQFLGGACALVTDYSSVAVDVRAAGGRVFLVQPDAEAYGSTRGFNVDREQMALLGDVVPSYSELCSRLLASMGGPRTRIRDCAPPLRATARLFALVGLSQGEAS